MLMTLTLSFVSYYSRVCSGCDDSLHTTVKNPKPPKPFPIKTNKKSTNVSLQVRNWFMGVDIVKKQIQETPEF